LVHAANDTAAIHQAAAVRKATRSAGVMPLAIVSEGTLPPNPWRPGAGLCHYPASKTSASK
jgi:hypothetical protein